MALFHRLLTGLAVLALVPAPAAADVEVSGSSDPSCGCSRSWTAAAVTAEGALGDGFHAVTAVSEGEAFAVGQSRNADGTPAAAVQRWDGDRWSPTATPDLQGTFGSLLHDAAAASSTSVWAVGSVQLPPADPTYPPLSRPLVLHWDGSAWNQVAAPGAGPSENGVLTGVTVLADDDAWAVGSYLPDRSSPEQVQPLTLHWDGSSWSVVDSEDIGDHYASSRLNAVTATADDEVWAVGSGTDDGVVQETLVWRRERHQWVRVPSPSPRPGAEDSFGSTLSDVTDSERGLVAVGATGTDEFAIAWNGRRWSRIRTDVPGVAGFSGVAAAAGGGLVAVGTRVHPTTFDGLAVAVDIRRAGTSAPVDQVPGSFDTRLLDVTTVGEVQWAVGTAVTTTEDGGVLDVPVARYRCVP